MEVAPLHALNAENFMLSLPSVLAEDETMSALARSAAEQLKTLLRQTNLASVLIRIDELPEAVLDILAHDFRVDWYDSNADIEQKRRLIKTAFDVHRHKGTKAAVETAVSAISPGATVREWFEYSGTPFCFKLRIETDGRDLTDTARERLLRNVRYYKNIRSHLDTVEYTLSPDSVPPAPLRVAPVAGDAYMRISIPAPDMPEVYALGVTDGVLYEYDTGESSAPRFSVDNGVLYREYDETEQPPSYVIEDGVLYEEEAESNG